MPECEGCEYLNISVANSLALEIYNLASPGGELDFKGVEMLFREYGIRGSARARYLRKFATIRGVIQEHYASKKPN